MSDAKALSEKGKLKLAPIDTFQSFYGLALGETKEIVKKVSRATHAILDHYLENATHEKRPYGQSSWCSFNWDKSTGKNSRLSIKNLLPPAILVFDKLGSKEFLAASENVRM